MARYQHNSKATTLRDSGDIWQGYVFWVLDAGGFPAGWNAQRRGSPYRRGWGWCGSQSRAANPHAPVWFYADPPFCCPFCGARVRFRSKHQGRKRTGHTLTVAILGSATQR